MNDRENISKALNILDSILGMLFKAPKFIGEVLIVIIGYTIELIKMMLGLIIRVSMSVIDVIRSIKKYIVDHSTMIILIIASLLSISAAITYDITTSHIIENKFKEVTDILFKKDKVVQRNGMSEITYKNGNPILGNYTCTAPSTGSKFTVGKGFTLDVSEYDAIADGMHEIKYRYSYEPYPEANYIHVFSGQIGQYELERVINSSDVKVKVLRENKYIGFSNCTK